MPWPPTPADPDDDGDVFELALDEATQIEVGVTSGADPTEWSPIDEEGRVDSCLDEGGKGGGKSAAVCQAQDQPADKTH